MEETGFLAFCLSFIINGLTLTLKTDAHLFFLCHRVLFGDICKFISEFSYLLPHTGLLGSAVPGVMPASFSEVVSEDVLIVSEPQTWG